MTARLRGLDLQLVGDARRPGGAGFADQLARTKAYLGIDESKADSRKVRWPAYAAAAASCGVATALAWLLFGRFEATNLVMVYLVGVLVVAYRYGRGPASPPRCCRSPLFDFLFVAPYYSFAVSDTQYLLTFAVMLLVGLTISSLTAGVRLQARVAQHRQARTEALYTMTRELSRAGGLDEVVTIAVQHVARVFEAQAVVLVPSAGGTIAYPQAPGIYGSYHGADLGIARWVYANRVAAGLGTNTLPGAEALYLPLAAAHKLVGVLAVCPRGASGSHPRAAPLLETFAGQIAAAAERVLLAADAAKLARQAETESLRNSLLNAISHDLRTPLAVLVGASSSLITDADRLSERGASRAGGTVHEEATRMTRWSTIFSTWRGSNRGRSRSRANGRRWRRSSAACLAGCATCWQRIRSRSRCPRTCRCCTSIRCCWGNCSANLLENAAKYTPSGSPVEISAQVLPGRVAVEVADRGPGIPAGEETKLFDKFYRLQREAAQSGVGLGLAICKAIVAAHGGTISAANRLGGGAVFRFELPAGEPPSMEPEADARVATGTTP